VSYTVLLERQAEKELRSLPSQMLRRIDKRLLDLADKPLPRGVVKLKGKRAKAGVSKRVITVFYIPLMKQRR